MKAKRKIKACYWLVTRKLAKMLNFSAKGLRAIISAFISNYFFNIIFFPLLGYSMLINYMAVNDFFSYEIVSESLFAVNIFIMTMIAGLMLTMVAVFGSAIIAFSNFAVGIKKLAPFSTYWPLFILNLIFGFIVIYPVFFTEDKSFPLFVLAISGYLAIHYTLFLFGNLKTKIIALGALLLISVGGTFFEQDLSSKVFSNGLRAFGVGGNVSMRLYDEVTPEGTDINVLLITPKAVYFKQNGATGLVPIDKVKKLIQTSEI